MVKSVLSDYLRNRMDKTTPGNDRKDFGPLITISRAYGCPAKVVAQDLSLRLNTKLLGTKGKRWKWISKEILDESAKELKLDKYLIKEAVNSDTKGIMDDLIISLANKFYPSDAKVKKTLAEIIKSFTKEGNVIIVGRAGVSLTRNVQNSLHIRLDAPVEWRAEMISETQRISHDEARRKLLEIDYKRNLLREYFEGKKPDNSIFDIIFNYQTMNENEILESIIRLMELKNMI